MNRNLVRTLCLREPGARYRFSLRLVPEPELAISPARRSSASDVETSPSQPGVSGAIVVDEKGKLVFLVPTDPGILLNAVAGWARSEAASPPAAAILIGAGATQWKGDSADPAAVAAIDLQRMAIHRDDKLWIGLVRPDPAQIAEVLNGILPGERLWYWLTERPGTFELPLLLQEVTTDPNRDGLNALLDFVEAGSPGPAVTGIAYATEDGAIQFVGRDLKATHLEVLANWVRTHVERHPSLARLSGCRLVLTAQGKAREVLADDGLWSGIPRPASPGTAAETDKVLAAMRPGESYWFWATASAADGAFLSLVPVSGDPEGDLFRARVEGFLRRFPGSHAHAFVGTLRCAEDGTLRFLASRGAPSQWPDLLAGLARIHPASAAQFGRAELKNASAGMPRGTAA